jgi:uncharacterized protein
MLGKTGAKNSTLILGTGSRFMATEEDKGLEILEYALNNGLYYWDTANTYTKGSGPVQRNPPGENPEIPAQRGLPGHKSC